MDVQMDGETISGAEFSVLAVLSHGWVGRLADGRNYENQKQWYISHWLVSAAKYVYLF